MMMFLQFFIWGGWFVTLGTFLSSNLNATGSQVGMAFSTQSWGAIVAPFIIGLIADRFFNAEKILAILHLVGAALLFQMHSATDFSVFYPYVLGYMVVYMPTLALVNSVAFKQINDPSKEFAKIRVWGTIGWISAGLAISYLFGWDARDSIDEGFLSNTFLLSSGAAFVLGIFSFTLPATPPAARSQEKITLREIIGADAFGRCFTTISCSFSNCCFSCSVFTMSRRALICAKVLCGLSRFSTPTATDASNHSRVCGEVRSAFSFENKPRPRNFFEGVSSSVNTAWRSSWSSEF
jgi:nucleoside transporter